MKNVKKIKGTPGIEPGTSRSAVECSTPELYPRRLCPISNVILIQFYKLEVATIYYGEIILLRIIFYLFRYPIEIACYSRVNTR